MSDAREPTASARHNQNPASERMAPFYCPYCAEEDLEPYGEHGGWYCRSCARAFHLSFVGIGVRS